MTIHNGHFAGAARWAARFVRASISGGPKGRPYTRWLRALPTVGYMLLIFGVSSVPSRDLPALIDDRVLHFAEYFVLGVLMVFSVTAWMRRGAMGVSWFLASAYAATDEWHQSFVAGRDSSLKDIAFDLLGITVALSVLILLLRQSTR